MQQQLVFFCRESIGLIMSSIQFRRRPMFTNGLSRAYNYHNYKYHHCICGKKRCFLYTRIDHPKYSRFLLSFLGNHGNHGRRSHPARVRIDIVAPLGLWWVCKLGAVRRGVG